MNKMNYLNKIMDLLSDEMGYEKKPAGYVEYKVKK